MFRADGKNIGVITIYRSLIIGCGKIAGLTDNDDVNDFTHGYAYTQNSKINLLGCMDISKRKAKAFAKKFNCKYYDDISTGIKDIDPHIVSICSPVSPLYINSHPLE